MHGRTVTRQGGETGTGRWRLRRPGASYAKRVVAVVCGLILCIGLVLGLAPTALATQSATIDLTSHENMYIDSNKPVTEGPRGAWLSFLVTNTGDETLNDLTMTFSGFTNYIDGVETATVLFEDPSDLTPTFNSMVPNSIDPNETLPVYFYVDYSGAIAYGASLSPQKWDGLTATYTVTVTSSTSGATELDSYLGTVVITSSLSANAGGSDVSSTLGPGIWVGQILTQTTTYKYGNNTDVCFQPSGIAGFNDATFRLVGNEIIGISGFATGKEPTGIYVGDKDRLRWPTSDVPDSGTTFTMVYYWEVLDTGISTSVNPWANALSGTKYKYLSQTEATPLSQPASAPLVVTKSVWPYWLPTADFDGGLGTGIVRYTVTFQNDSDSVVNPVTGTLQPVDITLSRITDALPAGVSMVDSTYSGTDAEITGNSASVPASGATSPPSVSWVGKGARHNARHYSIAAGASLTLVYTASVVGCSPGAYTNSVTGTVGKTAVGPATATVTIGGTPTLAVVSDFQAYRDGSNVVVTWETTSEVGTAGYYVERRNGNSNQWTRVNRDLVPALFESPTGGYYSLVDRGARAGESLSYRLVEMELSGSWHVYGPFDVTADAMLPGGQAAAEIAQGNDSVRIPKLAQSALPGKGRGANNGLAKKAGATMFRIEVAASGLYRIEAADIVDGLGVSTKDAVKLIRTGGLSLTTVGRKVAYMPATDGSALYFYGQAIDSIYSANNVYWLAKGPGKIMASAKRVKVAEPDPPTVTEFVDQVHAEENTFAYSPLSHDPATDIWLWAYLIAGNPGLQAKTFALDAPEATQGVLLDALLWGFSDTVHHVEIQLNGVQLGEVRWTGNTSKAVSLPIPWGVLQSGTNQVRLVTHLDDPASYSILGVESFDLTYKRTTKATSGTLLLTAPSTGSVMVSGLGSGDAWVFDLTDPRLPEVVAWTESAGEAGTTAIAFNAEQQRRYLVVGANAALEPQALTATVESSLRSSGRGAEYVIITAASLADAAARYAAYRASTGLTAAVVTTSEIYDEFNYGIPDPHAIQSFIKEIATQWQPRARYVLLAGEGSLDFKDYLGYGDCVVPSLVIDGGICLVPSDAALADVFGHDGLSEVAIGRIPALTAADLDTALAKVKAYEASQGIWRQSVLLVADNPDSGGDFYAESDMIAGTLPSELQIGKAYLGQISLTEARSSVSGAFNNGALLVNYVGHASAGQLAAEKLLAVNNVNGLRANAGLPILVALSCQVGDFGLPGYSGLAESLVKANGAGAISVWAPVNAQLSADSVRLGTLLYHEMFASSRTIVLGDAIQAAKAAAEKEKLPISTLQCYSLLGDPGLRVQW